MSVELRILLIISSVIMMIAVMLRIRKSKFQIHDGIFWFVLSLLFLILSIFPQIAINAANLLGIESPVNLVFLCVLALLIIKNFLLSLKLSLLEYNLTRLAQKTAIEQALNNTDKEDDKKNIKANIRDEK